MKRLEKIITYTQYSDIETLEPKDRELIIKANEASLSSYSPYSQFRVGAALRLGNGEIIQSSNQENAAYPSGLCAERVGLFYAGTKTDNVEAIAIVGVDKDNQYKPAYPCGSCLAVMLEMEKRIEKPLRIIVQTNENCFEVFQGVNSLMPFFVEI